MASAISWGKRRLAQRGIVNPSMVNYGYEHGENNEWVIKPEEAKIVKRIYKEFLKGETFAQITKNLTEDTEIKSPKGNNYWSETTVKSILTNEVYRGNFLYNRSYTKETIGKKVVPNKGELPMYLVENHHEAIISSKDWEKVQKIHADRIKAIRESIKVKYPKGTGKNEAFSKKFYCGECGGLIGYKRSVQGKRKNKRQIFAWRCNVSEKSSDYDMCEARYIRQEYIELNFMNMLIDLQQNPEFNNYLKELIASTKLNADEERVELELKNEMDLLNQELYEVVDTEQGKKGQDIKKVDELTEKIVELQNQLKVYTNRKEQVNQIKEDLDWLAKEIKDLYGNDTDKELWQISIMEQTGFYDVTIPFKEEIFQRIVESGIIFDNRKIVFKLKCGIEWSASLLYSDYQKMLGDQETFQREANKEAFLNGPEIKKLLDFCKEPKSLVEINAFLKKYTSKTQLEKAIVHPLMKDERLKRKKDISNKRWQYVYYSV